MSANPDLTQPEGDVTDWLGMVMDQWQQRLSLDPSEMATLGEMFRGQAFTMANVWDTSFLDDIAESIEEALAGQVSMADWIDNAQEILDRYGDATGLTVYTGEDFTDWYAELVFRQATQSAYAAGAYADMFAPQNVDFDPYWQYVTAGDDKVRPAHQALEGKIFRKRDEWARHFLPPLGWNCATGETRVAGRFRSASRALFTGTLVEVETARGARFTVTADHPVFTVSGPLPSIELAEGLGLFRHRGGIETSSGIDGQNTPATASQVFDALKKAGTRARGMRVNLYGNAGRRQRDVEVVTVDRELADAPRQRGGQLMLETANVPKPSRPRSRALRHLGIRSLASTRSLPRRRTLALHQGAIRADARPFQALGFGSTATLDAVLSKKPLDRKARNAELLRQALLGEAAPIETDQVARVRKFDAVMRPVFDFEGAHGVILADGIAQSNCRCIAIPLGPDDAGEEDIAATAASLDYEDDNGDAVQAQPDEGFDQDRVAQLVPDILKRLG